MNFYRSMLKQIMSHSKDITITQEITSLLENLKQTPFSLQELQSKVASFVSRLNMNLNKELLNHKLFELR